ncbi:MAG: helix-turn-helix transcriptional regulator [Archangium sp.]|nr:helix-turn-helix transcriptional regulator [Archangium sp.]
MECFWVARWQLEGQSDHRVELLSDPCVNVAFEAGASRVVGVSTRLFERVLHGRGLVRAAKLKAGAVRAFLSVHAAQLTDAQWPIRAYLPTANARLARQVLAPEDHREGLDVMRRWLEAVRLPKDEDVALATEVVTHIADTVETTSVAALRRQTGLSERALQRLFRDHVGASPKWVIRRNRLQEAAVRLERGAVSLTDLAFELGYADHAHLTRDFKAATGKAPSAFVKGLDG